jgi:hypothetical protein
LWLLDDPCAVVDGQSVKEGAAVVRNRETEPVGSEHPDQRFGHEIGLEREPEIVASCLLVHGVEKIAGPAFGRRLRRPERSVELGRKRVGGTRRAGLAPRLLDMGDREWPQAHAHRREGLRHIGLVADRSACRADAPVPRKPEIGLGDRQRRERAVQHDDPCARRCRVGHGHFRAALAAQQTRHTISAGRDQFGRARLHDLPSAGHALDGERICPAEQRQVRDTFQRTREQIDHQRIAEIEPRCGTSIEIRD